MQDNNDAMWSRDALGHLADSLDSNPGIIRALPVEETGLKFDMFWFHHPSETMPSAFDEPIPRLDSHWLAQHENFRRVFGRTAVAAKLGQRVNLGGLVDYGMATVQELELSLQTSPLDGASTREEWDETMLLIAHHTVAYANLVLLSRMVGSGDRLQASAALLSLAKQQADFDVQLISTFPRHLGLPSTDSVRRLIDFIGEVSSPSGLARLAAATS